VTVNAAVNFGMVSSGDETICNGGDPSNITFVRRPHLVVREHLHINGIHEPVLYLSKWNKHYWMDITSRSHSSSYDPPSGLSGNTTYAVLVDATGSPDCGVATWASSCRKVTVNAAVNFGNCGERGQTIL
jgi:hypothetical protein